MTIQNPMDKFFENSDAAMLNEALPYVSPGMRKPLAMYLKIMEMEKIKQDFDNPDTLSACGFNNTVGTPEDMLTAMRRHAGSSMAGRIDTILSLMQATRLYHTYNEAMLSMQSTQQQSSSDNNINSQDNSSQDMIAALLPVLMKEARRGNSTLNPDIIEKMKSILKGADSNESTVV